MCTVFEKRLAFTLFTPLSFESVYRPMAGIRSRLAFFFVSTWTVCYSVIITTHCSNLHGHRRHIELGDVIFTVTHEDSR